MLKHSLTYLILLFFLINSQAIFSQNYISQKTMEEAVNNPNTADTLRLRFLISLVDSINDPTVWEPLNEQAFDLGSRLSVHRDERHRYLGKLFLADAINNRGFAEEQRGNINKTIELYFESLSIRESIGYEIGIASAFNNLSNIFSEQGDTLRALDYLHKSLEIRKKVNDKHGIAQCLNNIGRVYIAYKSSEAALPYFQESAQIYRELGGQRGLSKALYNLGNVHLLKGQYEDARKMYSESLTYLLELKDDESIARTIRELGGIDFDEGKYREAENKCKQAIVMSQAGKYIEVEADAYLLLNKIYTQKGDFKYALELYKKYIETRQRISNISIQNRAAQYQYAYEYEKKNAELKTSQEQAEKEANLRKIYYIIAIVLLLLFSTILFYLYRVRSKANKALEEKNILIEAARNKAEESERFKTQFLSNISHEIRTPMNAIFGMSNLLIDTPLDTQQKSYLNAIKNSSENLLLIINDVLDFSKLEAGKMLLEQTPFMVDKVLDDVYNTLRFKAQEKGLIFNCKKNDDIAPYLLGDGFRLYQVLLNLASNAIKFTDKGTVDLDIQLIKNQDNKQKILFSVRDSGVGIPREKMETIFESFQQATSGIARQYGGTGLGLSISQQLIALRGSKIEVESELGKGSRFFFAVEYDKSNEEEYDKTHGDPEIEDPQKLKNLKILLAEDNEYNRILAVDSLKKILRHVTIHEVETGIAVLNAVMEYDYDLILMDINMPEMSGYEATQQIRNHFPDNKKDIPIVALTAYSREEEEKQCFDVGMNDIVTKPFKLYELLNAIKKIILLKTAEEADNQFFEKNNTVEKTDFDFSFLKDFTEGNVDDMKYFIEKFIKTIPPHFEKLQVAINEKDGGKVKKIAHNIKPQVEFVGIKKATAAMRMIEDKAIGEMPNFELIQNLCDETLEEIEKAKAFWHSDFLKQ